MRHNSYKIFSCIHTAKKPYISLGLFCSIFLVFNALYIYGINESAVHTLTIEKTKKQIHETKDQLRALEVERSHMTIGISLEEQAQQQNLFAARSLFFVSRDSSVAQGN